MKKVILNLIVIGMVCFSTNAMSQNKTPRATKEKTSQKTKKNPRKQPQIKSKSASSQNMELMEIDSSAQMNKRTFEKAKPNNLTPSISRITDVPQRVKHLFGFLVVGTAGSNKEIEVVNKVHWRQKGYNYVRTKEYELIKVTSENDGTWKAKMERPYRSVPASAYDIKFEISSKQYPYPLHATLPEPSIVYGTMAPPAVERIDGNISLPSSAGPGGMYSEAYTTISGNGIPGMDIEINVGTEYQSPKNRYNSGDPEMNTYVMEGETKTTKISSDGTWTIKVKVPNPNSRNHSYGVYYFKLAVEATQSASSSDVSAIGKKKFDI